ncbi:complex I NDUFA9 subunit family protein [Crenobacter cavernae]|uniref:Complex I NDUFA9 subunit family protein n=1 Tax=Crenobacter cavernae TaxID=2290923 RepID=A0ABY0FAB1_9NEIS|nr:complex I NDUFA9 subunit family protein [Crenobacter cavernae]RXZ42601.1 complex I NDUFA9 subunit family protein [Crenobacter cavernae]
MKFQRIAVIGGSGFLGTYIAERLVEQDVELTIPSRRRERNKLELILLPKTQLEETDVNDAAALNKLLAGHDAVVSMVGILHGNAKSFEAAHVELVKKIVDAMKANGIRRLVHISALGANENGPSLYQQSKGRGERVVMQSGLDWTILRPSVVFGRGDHFLNLFAALGKTLPVLPLAGADTRFAPIWVDDVARAVVACFASDATLGQRYELTGPKTYTLRELARYATELSGNPRHVIGLPHSVAMLQAGLMEILPGPTLISRDNVRSLAVDNVSDQPFPADVMGFAPAELETVAPKYLSRAEFNANLSRYREEAGRR